MSGSYARCLRRYASGLKLVFYLLIAISAVSAYFWPQDSPDRLELFVDRLRSMIFKGLIFTAVGPFISLHDLVASVFDVGIPDKL